MPRRHRHRTHDPGMVITVEESEAARRASEARPSPPHPLSQLGPTASDPAAAQVFAGMYDGHPGPGARPAPPVVPDEASRREVATGVATGIPGVVNDALDAVGGFRDTFNYRHGPSGPVRVPNGQAPRWRIGNGVPWNSEAEAFRAMSRQGTANPMGETLTRGAPLSTRLTGALGIAEGGIDYVQGMARLARATSTSDRVNALAQIGHGGLDMVSGTATLVAGATGANATGLTTGLGRAAGVAEMGRGAYNLWNTWGTYDPRTNREDTAQATEGAQQLLHGGLATWGASSPIGSAAALGAGIGNMMVTHADALAQRENRYGANPNALLTERGVNARGVAASGSDVAANAGLETQQRAFRWLWNHTHNETASDIGAWIAGAGRAAGGGIVNTFRNLW